MSDDFNYHILYIVISRAVSDKLFFNILNYMILAKVSMSDDIIFMMFCESVALCVFRLHKSTIRLYSG